MGLSVLLVLVVIVSTVWVGFDAGAHKEETGRDPLLWVVGCLLLWVGFFPAYVALRLKPTKEWAATLAEHDPGRAGRSTGHV